LGDGGGFFAVSESVDDTEEDTVLVSQQDDFIAAKHFTDAGAYSVE
jgi:hypothetical protein